MAAKREIIISIEESGDARVFEKESDIIQQDALATLRGCVAETLYRIEDFKEHLKQGDDIWARHRHHDVIAIFGGRGTGKTTFILNALNTLSEGTKPDFDLVNIGIIDPTLVECRESIFLNIISRIRVKVDEFRKKTHLGHTRHNAPYEGFVSHLDQLAKGLSQLNGIGTKALSHEAWDDPSFIMQEGLHNVQRGEELEQDFHVFLDRALDFLGKKAFIMAFDDIDTDFSRGWDVLEILRKYITSPQLVVLLSGDFELYSNLARMEQWKHFNAAFIKKERDSSSSASREARRFRERMDSLEDQYLLKILKSERRIELKSLEQVVGDHDVFVIRKQGDEKKPLCDFIRNFLITNYHLTHSTGLNAAVNHLLKLPVRTVIQVLRCWESIRHSTKAESDASPFSLHEGMAAVFATPLAHFGFRRPKDILAARTRFGMNILAQRLLQNDLLQDGAALPVTLGTDDRASAALTMSGYYAEALRQQSSLVVDYYIKVLLTRDTLGDAAKDKQEAYFKAVSLEVDEPSLTTARKHGAYSQEIVYRIGTRPINRGYLRLSGEWIQRQSALDRIRNLWGLPSLTKESLKDGSYNKDDVSDRIRPFLEDAMQDGLTFRKGQFIGRYYNTTNSLSRYISSWHKAIANLLFAGITEGGRQNAHFLSAYQLVALVGQLVELNEEELRNLIKRNLEPLQLLRHQPELRLNAEPPKESPRSKNRDEEDDVQDAVDDDEEGGEEQRTRFETLEDFLSAVKAWKDAYDNSKNKALPLAVHEAIWNRFHENLDKIAEDLRELFAGHVLGQFCVAFLNSVLVEEAWYRQPSITLNLDKPIRSERNFIDNMGYVAEQGDVCTYFNWMLACPLWSIVLRHDSKAMEKHREALGRILAIQDLAANGFVFAKVDYHGAAFDNLHLLLNTLALPYQHKPITNIGTTGESADQAQKSALHALLHAVMAQFVEEAKVYIENLKSLKELKKSAERYYYNPMHAWLTDNWDDVLRLYRRESPEDFGQFVYFARHSVFADIASDLGYTGGSVNESSDNGQAYLRAFFEVYLDKMQ